MAVELPPVQAGADLLSDREPRPLVGRKLPPEVVAAEHRRRIATGLCEAIARCGYAATTVRDVIEPAGISRRTFYDLYRDKAQAFRVVHGEALNAVGDVVERACAAEGEWVDAVAVGLAAALRWAADAPPCAHILVAEPLTAGPRLSYCHDHLVERFAPGLRRGRAHAPAELPDHLEELIVGGIAGVVAAHLRTGCAAELPRLVPQLIELALAPYLGPAEAGRVAAAHLA